MGVVRRVFRGAQDPDRVTLTRVFPLGTVVFSTPFEDLSSRHRVVVEGSDEELRALEGYLVDLLHAPIDEAFFGSWSGLGVNIWGAWELFYNPGRSPANAMRLLAVVLREHLIRVCNLRLAEVAVLTAMQGGIVVAQHPVPLGGGVGNGSRLLTTPPKSPIVFQ